MKPGKGKLLVWVNMNQKSQYELRYGCLSLQVKSDFGHDGNVKNPVLCEKYEGGGCYLVHHNTFDMKQGADVVTREGGYLVGDTGIRREDGAWLFGIKKESVHVEVSENGDPVAAEGWVIVKRVRKKRGQLLQVEGQLLENVVYCEGGDSGQDGAYWACMPHAAYRSWYIWNGEQREVWRVLRENLLAEVESRELEVDSLSTTHSPR